MIHKQPERLYYWDYLRAFMITLVVLEHALLPYSPLFKKTAFIHDFEGNTLFDIWHLHNDAIMMPMLFLIAGFFLLNSFKSKILSNFMAQKFWRWGVPFILGIIFLVPLLTYPRDLIYFEEPVSYGTYLKNYYFFDKIQAGGFWFLYYLTLLSSIFLLVNQLIPKFLLIITKTCKWLLENPVRGIISFTIVCAIVLGISDLLYGAFVWKGFGKIFYVRGSRYIIKIIFFLIGIGLSQIPQSYITDKLSKIWPTSLLFAIISIIFYSYFVITNYYTGAFNYEFSKFIKSHNFSYEAYNILKDYSLSVLIRTTLLAASLTSLSLFYISSFMRFLNRPIQVWQSLAVCSFGIYIFHEPLQVWMTYFLYDENYSEYLKFPVVFLISFIGSWALTHILKIKSGFNKVL